MKVEQIALAATDGYTLGATRYHAADPLAGHLIVAGATGVPRKFYARFAKFAAKRGFTTLTLDYRGIGGSKPKTLKGFRMDFLDWAGLDLAAAVETMADEEVPLFLVGHSFGGHALGSLPNHRRIKGAFFLQQGQDGMGGCPAWKA